MKLVHKQGYLALDWKQKAPDIRLADVKVCVITVMLTELKFFPQYNAHNVDIKEINVKDAGQGTSVSE
jgi:hypothetical protein